MPASLYVTYNPGNGTEKKLAVRLHTIGAVNGFRMFLPDRQHSHNILDEESKGRIGRSEYLILFSAGPISPIVEQEIEYAYRQFGDARRILIVRDLHTAQPLNPDSLKFTVFEFDSSREAVDSVLHEILESLFPETPTKGTTSTLIQNPKLKKELGALLLVGLGLFLLSQLSDDEQA